MADLGKKAEIKLRKLARIKIYEKYKNTDRRLLDENIVRYLYHDMRVMSESELNDKMREKLYKNEPFMFGRLGVTEAHIVGEYIEKTLGVTSGYNGEWTRWLYQSSGFFGNEADMEYDMDEYSRMTLDAVGVTDYYACYHPTYIDYIAKHYAKKAELFQWNSVTGCAVSAAMDNHWSKGLEGKKVLVVSAFTDSIRQQYAIKDKLCKNPERCLPDFELITIKSPETQVGYNTDGYRNWFEAYRRLEDEVLKRDFDVALIGCGAYGYPLAGSVRKTGRTVIELCGSVVKLFGIYGWKFEQRNQKRLDEWGAQYWTCPIETPPEQSKYVEEAGYWRKIT
jgi:hypothetical protein